MERLQIIPVDPNTRFEMLFIFIQGMALLLFCLLAKIVDAQGEMLILIGLWNSVIYFFALTHELNRPWSSPIIFYLGMSLLRGGLSPLIQASSISNHELPHFMSYCVQEYIVMGTLLLNFEEYLILAGYWLWRKRYRKDENLIAGTLVLSPNTCFGFSLGIYILIVVSRIFNHYVSMSSFGKIGGFMAGHAAGLMPMLFLVFTLSLYPKSMKCKILLWSILFLEINNVIFYASKQSFIVLLIPFALLFCNRIKCRHQMNWKSWLKIGILMLVAFYLIINVIFPYVGALRSNENLSSEEIRNSVFMAVFKQQSNDIYDTQMEKNSFWDRNNWSIPAAFAVQYVEERGYFGIFFIKMGLLALVPRAIWWDKPLMNSGEWMDSLLRTGYIDSSSSSATGLGLGATVYFYGGVLSVLFFCLANGILLAVWERGIQLRCTYNPFAAMLLVMITVECMRHIEGSLDGGISGNCYYFFILFLAIVSDRYFQQLLPAAKKMDKAT